MLSVVTFRWQPPRGYRSAYAPKTVNVLAAMVRKFYDRPHRFFCCTDDADGLDPAIDVIPLWSDYADLPAPAGRQHPSCYRRLRAFAPDAAAMFGPRFVTLDLDCVVTGDLGPLWDRPEDFVIWGDTNPTTYYNGSMVLMTAGARAQVWTAFDPVRSPRLAARAGHWGSDQGWISYCLGPGEPRWSRADGVYSFRNDLAHDMRRLPADARIVMFHGPWDPWADYIRQNCPWVREWWPC